MFITFFNISSFTEHISNILNTNNEFSCLRETIYLSEVSIFSYLDTHSQIGKSTHFWEINIFAKTAEFVICVENLWICTVNGEILKNVINICARFPISKAAVDILNIKTALPHFQKGICSCVVPIPQNDRSSHIITFQNYHSWFLLICKMYRCFVPK